MTARRPRRPLLVRIGCAPVMGRHEAVDTVSWSARSNPAADAALAVILERAAKLGPRAPGWTDGELSAYVAADRLAVSLAASLLGLRR